VQLNEEEAFCIDPLYIILVIMYPKGGSILSLLCLSVRSVKKKNFVYRQVAMRGRTEPKNHNPNMHIC